MVKKNLLYIITKLELGGAQKQLLTLITQLGQGRYNLFLFTGEDGLLVKDALSINWLNVKRSSFLERKINPIKDIIALIEIYNFVKRNKIELVHTHSSKAGILGRLAARLAKAKIIIHTVHGWPFNDCQPYMLRILYIWLERLAAKFSDALITVSEYDMMKGLDNRIGKKEKYLLIRYGIDAGEFSLEDPSIRKEFCINDKDLIVGMVACFKPQKSVPDFIKLAALLNRELVADTLDSEREGIARGVKFLLVGDGAMRLDIERLIKRLGLEGHVILTGWRRDIPRIMPTIDVFVLTSLWEGLPIAVLEAMASERPVVVTNTGGVAELIV